MSTTIESDQEMPVDVSCNERTEFAAHDLLSTRKHTAKFWRGEAGENDYARGEWESWSRQLKTRRLPKTLDQLCKCETPLAWGLSSTDISDEAGQFIKLHSTLIHKRKPKLSAAHRQLLTTWTAPSELDRQFIRFAVECLSLVHLLPHLTSSVDETIWWRLLDELWCIVQESSGWQIDADLPAEQVLVYQLLACELPLAIAYLFPEIRELHKLRRSAEQNLSVEMVELLNGEGLPKAAHLAVVLPLTASWTRCRLLGNTLKKLGWSAEAKEQFSWLVTKSLMLTTPGGGTFLSGVPGRRWSADFLEVLLKVGGEKCDVGAARSLIAKKLTKRLPSKGTNELPESSDQCEWSGLAVMRTHWDSRANAVAVDFSSPNMRIEAWAGSQRLISGVWPIDISIDDRAVAPEGFWEQTCWFSDEDVDFLELTMELGSGVRLDRQIALFREEGLLFLADFVLGEGVKTSCRVELPLGSGVEFCPETDTREGLLLTPKPVARVLPLDLPEWRNDPRVGELFVNDGKLIVNSERSQQNLACPILFDLDRGRMRKECTWRQLTVAQALEIQPHEAAVGYRAQCGKDQWLIYRSMAPPANRTVLGQNLSVECLIARFLPPAGEVDELLQVEG